MAVEVRAEEDRRPPGKAAARVCRRLCCRGLTVPLRRFLGHHIFSSLTRRILFLNLAALGVLVIGILYLNQFRDGLIDARVESLMTQGEIIAGAIAASATVETDSITHRSGKAARTAGRRKPGAGLRPARQSRFPDQSRARRAGAAAADLADAHARPHLRPRRQSAARFAPSLFARPDPALRPAAGRGGGAGLARARPEVRRRLLPPHRPAGLQASSPAATARPIPR